MNLKPLTKTQLEKYIDDQRSFVSALEQKGQLMAEVGNEREFNLTVRLANAARDRLSIAIAEKFRRDKIDASRLLKERRKNALSVFNVRRGKGSY